MWWFIAIIPAQANSNTSTKELGLVAHSVIPDKAEGVGWRTAIEPQSQAKMQDLFFFSLFLTSIVFLLLEEHFL
jgi:hypothetical protein